MGALTETKNLSSPQERQLSSTGGHLAPARSIPWSPHAPSALVRLTAENRALLAEVTELKARIAKLTVVAPMSRMSFVTRRFIALLADAGYTIDGEPYALKHLASKRKGFEYCMPRNVCIAVVARLCMSNSKPEIGAHFGYDHSLIKHSIQRAPYALDRFPVLKVVADKLTEESK